jgi:hypothetical protein
MYTVIVGQLYNQQTEPTTLFASARLTFYIGMWVYYYR